MRHALLSLGLLVVGCESKAREPQVATPRVGAAARSASVAEPALQSEPSPSVRKFGAEPTLPGAPVAVEAVLAAADTYVGKTIKCEGKVARVCQAAGCWLELQAESGGEGLRVPMAAHAFFIPQDAVGHVAVVEGELKRRELVETQRKHYEGEGMKATGPLSLEATTVLVH